MNTLGFLYWVMFSRNGYLSRFWYVAGMTAIYLFYWVSNLYLGKWANTIIQASSGVDFPFMEASASLLLTLMVVTVSVLSGNALIAKRIADIGLKRYYPSPSQNIILFILAFEFIVHYLTGTSYLFEAMLLITVPIALPPSNFFVLGWREQ